MAQPDFCLCRSLEELLCCYLVVPTDSAALTSLPARLSGSWRLCWKNHSSGPRRAAWRRLCWQRSHILPMKSQGVTLVCGAVSVMVRGKVIFAVVQMGIMCRQRSRLAVRSYHVEWILLNCSHVVPIWLHPEYAQQGKQQFLGWPLLCSKWGFLSIILSWKQKHSFVPFYISCTPSYVGLRGLAIGKPQ